MPFSLYAQGLQTFIIFSPQALPSHQVISELKKRNYFFLMWRRELGVHAERTLWFSVSVAQESWHSNKRKQSWVLVHGLFLFIILQVLGRANSVMLKPECNFSFFFFFQYCYCFFFNVAECHWSLLCYDHRITESHWMMWVVQPIQRSTWCDGKPCRSNPRIGFRVTWASLVFQALNHPFKTKSHPLK